jgi:F-type H+-transporting ATPase subunit delta
MTTPIQKITEELKADASARRIARVYAEALLEEAQKRDAGRDLAEELDQLLADIAEADPELRNFLLGGVVSRKIREQAIEKAFAGRVSELLLNFLLVLNAHERLELLGLAVEAYHQLLEERGGQVKVRVRTAAPLDDGQRDRLYLQLKDMTKREPVLDIDVDPSLLGGLVVQVGDYLYDASVRTRLARIRNELIERSSHAIQTGRDRFSSSV